MYVPFRTVSKVRCNSAIEPRPCIGKEGEEYERRRLLAQSMCTIRSAHLLGRPATGRRLRGSSVPLTRGFGDLEEREGALKEVEQIRGATQVPV